MSRLAKCFSRTAMERRAALITFTMAFDPDYKTSLSILKKLPEAGADILEIGMPFSDPMADGPTIQEAGIRALKAGATVKKTISMVKEFRKGNHETPVILMGYYNPIHAYGIKAFVKDAGQAGVDGVLLVDLPPEEDALFSKELNGSSISLIRLIAPTSNEERIKKITKHASGFVYYVSVAGITGTKSAEINSIKKSLDKISKITDLPIAVGFGIKNPAQAKQISKISDAIVIGSALIKTIKGKKGSGAEKSAASFIKDISKSCHYP